MDTVVLSPADFWKARALHLAATVALSELRAAKAQHDRTHAELNAHMESLADAGVAIGTTYEWDEARCALVPVAR